MEKKEIFSQLGNGLINDIPKEVNFKEAVLNIMRLEGVVEFKSYIVKENNDKLNLEISMGYKYAKLVLELYTITQTEPPIHTNWNRAVFKLFPDNKFEIEYIFDKELQDEVDGYNKKFQ